MTITQQCGMDAQKRAEYHDRIIDQAYTKSKTGKWYNNRKMLHGIRDDIMCAFMTGKTSDERDSNECDEILE